MGYKDFDEITELEKKATQLCFDDVKPNKVRKWSIMESYTPYGFMVYSDDGLAMPVSNQPMAELIKKLFEQNNHLIDTLIQDIVNYVKT